MTVSDMDRQRKRERPAALYWIMGLAIGIIGGVVVGWGLATPSPVAETQNATS